MISARHALWWFGFLAILAGPLMAAAYRTEGQEILLG